MKSREEGSSEYRRCKVQDVDIAGGFASGSPGRDNAKVVEGKDTLW